MKATENKFPHNKEQVKIYFQYFPEDETFFILLQTARCHLDQTKGGGARRDSFPKTGSR